MAENSITPKKDQSSHKFATTFAEGFDDPRFGTWAREIDVPPKLDSLSKRGFRILDELTLFLSLFFAPYQMNRETISGNKVGDG